MQSQNVSSPINSISNEAPLTPLSAPLHAGMRALPAMSDFIVIFIFQRTSGCRPPRFAVGQPAKAKGNLSNKMN